MANAKKKQIKAAKRIGKAVRKAVSKGLSDQEISRTVNATLLKTEKAKPKKRRA